MTRRTYFLFLKHRSMPDWYQVPGTRHSGWGTVARKNKSGTPPTIHLGDPDRGGGGYAKQCANWNKNLRKYIYSYINEFVQTSRQMCWHLYHCDFLYTITSRHCDLFRSVVPFCLLLIVVGPRLGVGGWYVWHSDYSAIQCHTTPEPCKDRGRPPRRLLFVHCCMLTNNSAGYRIERLDTSEM